MPKRPIRLGSMDGGRYNRGAFANDRANVS